MAKSKAQDEKDHRTMEMILRNAQQAVDGEVPFGYDDTDDWYQTTIWTYKRLFGDEEFAAKFSALVAKIQNEPDPVVEFVKTYEGSFEFLNSLKDQVLRGRKLSEKQRAGAEKCMKRQAEWSKDRTPRGSGPTITEDGIYKVDDVIYKVQRSPQTGRLYAKKLVLTEDDASFVYESGIVFKLRPEHKLTLEQAKEYGTLYGVCVVCGRVLTDEESIAAGIGPICAGKEWW